MLKNTLLGRSLRINPVKLPTTNMQVIAVSMKGGWFRPVKGFLVDVRAFLDLAKEVCELDATLINKDYIPVVNMHPKIREVTMRIDSLIAPAIPAWAFPEAQILFAEAGKKCLMQIKEVANKIEKHKKFLLLNKEMSEEQADAVITEAIEDSFGDASLFEAAITSNIPTTESRTLH